MRPSFNRAAAAAALGLLLVLPAAASRAQAPAEAPFPSGEIPDVLRGRVGKPVTLLLTSGKEYGGAVAEVRPQSVVLRAVAGKEFYDAIVRLDEIAIVEIRRER